MTTNLHSDGATTYDTPIYRRVSFCRKVLTKNDKNRNAITAYLQGISMLYKLHLSKDVGKMSELRQNGFVVNLYNMQYFLAVSI